MTPRKVAEYVAAGGFLLLVGALVLGQAFGQPVLLSYVETGSMAPTLQPGDGFVAVPMAIAGPVERGDVIVFEAETLHGGGLTTHRVIGETEQGYVTKGDANPTTDQDAGEPPVVDAQIKAKALQIGGRVVVIPKIGLVVVAINGAVGGFQQHLASLFNTRALLGTQGFAYLLFIIGVGSYIASELRGRKDQKRKREIPRRRDAISGGLVVVALTVLVLIFLTASMTIPAGTQKFEVVSSTTDAPGPEVIRAGTSESFSYRVPSNGILPVVVFLEPSDDGIEVEPTTMYVPSNSVRESIVELHAPAQTGYYRYYLVEHRYLAVLPQNVIRALYEIHPWTPIVVIDVLIGGGFAGVAFALIGGGRTRVRSRDIPTVERLRRWLR